MNNLTVSLVGYVLTIGALAFFIIITNIYMYDLGAKDAITRAPQSSCLCEE